MKLRQIVSLVTVMFMVVAVFSGCGKESAASTSSTVIDANAAPIKLASGDSEIRIVRPTDSTQAESDAAVSVFKAIKENLGITAQNRTDDTEPTEGVIEIIVGNTNRSESATAKDLILGNGGGKSKDYIICAIGGNIVINAMSEKSFSDAAEYFISTYLAAGEISGSLCDIHFDDAPYYSLSVNGNTNLYGYSIVRSHYETSYITQVELEKLQTTLLEKFGYYIPIVEDAYVEAGDKEIIIGGSNREGQEDFTDYNKYDIRVNGSKIYLDGGNDWSVAMAVTEFTNALESGNVELKDGSYKSGDYTQTIGTYDTTKYYKYVWGDDFDGTEIDEQKWDVCRGNTMTSKGVNNKTVYRCTDKSTYIKDGCLYQCALEDEKGYYGGMLRTTDKMHFKYGYIEIKEKMPHGDGFWTALWLNGADYNKSGNIGEGLLFPEIDVTENFGNSNIVTPTMHRWPTAEGTATGIEEWSTRSQSYTGSDRVHTCPDGKTFNDDFHTFGCLWTPESVKFTCDGKIYFEQDITQNPLDVETFNHYTYIICSLATYFANCPLTPAATAEQWQNSNKFIVDYIHLYQLDSDLINIYY